MYKNIIFDLDGTLFDTFNLHVHCIKATYRKIYNEDISTLKILKHTKSTVWLQMKCLFDNDVEIAMKFYSEYFCSEIERNKLLDTMNVKGYLEQLNNRSEKIALHLFTGRDKITTMSILQYYNLHKCFHSVSFCENNEEKMSLNNINNVFGNLIQFVYVTDSVDEVNAIKKYRIPTYLANWFAKNPSKNKNSMSHICQVISLLEDENV